ncbi:MAG TPA: hypothetical protein PLS49_01930 [Candidatus Woesebacteria bacterium]|nr:hypothetical protein [Candidatus Woesebacteria bacterium]
MAETTKTIVTHISPDLDAIGSSWLIQRYMPEWDAAEHAFVPAGQTLDGTDPDADPNIIHVDTGLGKFDHHQLTERTSATKRVFDYLAAEGHIKEKDLLAVEHMVQFITEIDNFGEVHFPDPTNDRYTFCVHEFIYPLRGKLTSDTELVSMTFLILDSILFTIKNNLQAEEEIKEGLILKTKLGKTLIMETKNEAAIKYALKSGYEVVVRKDPESGHVRIKTQPNEKYDLTKLYKKILQIDGKASWFLHASKNMLLNGSSKAPDSVPSSLSLARIVEILKEM